MKPFADLALAATLVRADRRTPFDAVLAHNAEAALAALLARPAMRRPVVYVAHTVLGHELATYAPPRFGPALQRIGAAIDRSIARRADAVIALARAGEHALAPHARGAMRRIPPGLAADAAPPAERDRRCVPAPRTRGGSLRALRGQSRRLSGSAGSRGGGGRDRSARGGGDPRAAARARAAAHRVCRRCGRIAVADGGRGRCAASRARRRGASRSSC